MKVIDAADWLINGLLALMVLLLLMLLGFLGVFLWAAARLVL